MGFNKGTSIGQFEQGYDKEVNDFVDVNFDIDQN